MSIDYSNRPGQTDERAITNIVHLTHPAMTATHQSKYSRWAIILPSGKCHVIVSPLAAAVAVENAGYSCNLVGRLNEDNEPC